MIHYPEELQQKIEASQSEIHKLDSSIGRVKAELGAVLAAGAEKQADALQKKRDEMVRALERCELRLEALKGETASCERLDAQGRLNEIAGAASALAKTAEAARQKYESLLSQLISSVDAAFSPSLHRKELQAEAEFLAEKFNLPVPSLPEVVQPEPGAVGVVYRRCVGFFELLHNRSEWGTKLAEMQGERKRARKQAELARERESGARISL